MDKAYIRAWKDKRLLNIYGVDLLTLIISFVILSFYGSYIVRSNNHFLGTFITIGALLFNWTYLKSVQWSQLLKTPLTKLLFFRSLLLNVLLSIAVMGVIWVGLFFGYALIASVAILISGGIPSLLVSVLIAIITTFLFIPVIIIFLTYLDRINISFYKNTKFKFKIGRLKLLCMSLTLMGIICLSIIVWIFPINLITFILTFQLFLSWLKLYVGV